MDGPPAPLPRLAVTCRPARPSDTPAMHELTRAIWDGHDYVPLVWEDWLADPEGQLVAAEATDPSEASRLVGVGKLSRLSQYDWWLEGLRVDPGLEGRGVASQIHDYILKTWLEIGAGTLRLATFSNRYPVHHLCRRDGFHLAAEVSFCKASSLPGADLPQAGGFSPVEITEIDQALAFAQQTPGLAFSSGLVDLLWRWGRPRLEYLAEAQSTGRLFWWRERQGLLSFSEDYDEEESDHWPLLQFLGCTPEAATDYLQDFRRLAASLGFPLAGWVAPVQPGIAAVVESAGFQSEGEHTLYLFAREHPQKPEISPAV